MKKIIGFSFNTVVSVFFVLGIWYVLIGTSHRLSTETYAQGTVRLREECKPDYASLGSVVVISPFSSLPDWLLPATRLVETGTKFKTPTCFIPGAILIFLEGVVFQVWAAPSLITFDLNIPLLALAVVFVAIYAVSLFQFISKNRGQVICQIAGLAVYGTLLLLIVGATAGLGPEEMGLLRQTARLQITGIANWAVYGTAFWGLFVVIISKLFPSIEVVGSGVRFLPYFVALSSWSGYFGAMK